MVDERVEADRWLRPAVSMMIALAALMPSSTVASTIIATDTLDASAALEQPAASVSTGGDNVATTVGVQPKAAANVEVPHSDAPPAEAPSPLAFNEALSAATMSPAAGIAANSDPKAPGVGAGEANAHHQPDEGAAPAGVIPAALLNDDPTLPADDLLAKPETSPVDNRDSMDNLDLVLGQRQAFSDLVSLQDRIITDQRPVANAVGRFSSQSDKLDIAWEEVSQDIFFHGGRGRIRPGLQFIRYDPDVGNRIDQRSVGGDGSYRFSDLAAVTGDFWLNRLMPKAARNDTIPTYDVYVTLWPSDYIRADIDTRREIFDNIRSLQLHITASTIGGSVDFTPTNRTRLTIRGSGSSYSDHNDRWSVEGEALQRVDSQPQIDVGLRATGFHFSKLLNDGYFNPRSYESGEAMFRLQSALSSALNFELAASGGIEHASPGGSKPLVKASAQLSYMLLKNWTLDGGVSYFSSRQSNSSGFARTTGTIGLHYRFK